MIPFGLQISGTTNLALRTRGGQGLVFDGKYGGQPCVVKISDPDIATLESAERFERELETLGLVRHRFIERLLGHGVVRGGQLDGQPYLVLEDAGDFNLRAWRGRDAFAPQGVLLIAKQLFEVLAYLHDETTAPGRIVHRDIKPENIIKSAPRPGDPDISDRRLRSTSEIRLVDFGVVKRIGVRDETLTFTEQGVGTKWYMPPEAKGERSSRERAAVTPAWDIWAAGVTLYELGTARPVYTKGGEPMRPVGADPLLMPLLKVTMALEPRKRPTAKKALALSRKLYERAMRARDKRS